MHGCCECVFTIVIYTFAVFVTDLQHLMENSPSSHLIVFIWRQILQFCNCSASMWIQIVNREDIDTIHNDHSTYTYRM